MHRTEGHARPRAGGGMHRRGHLLLSWVALPRSLVCARHKPRCPPPAHAPSPHLTPHTLPQAIATFARRHSAEYLDKAAAEPTKPSEFLPHGTDLNAVALAAAQDTARTRATKEAEVEKRNAEAASLKALASGASAPAVVGEAAPANGTSSA